MLNAIFPPMPNAIPPVPSSVAIPVIAVAALVPVGGFLAAALGARAAGLSGWLRLGLFVAAGLLAWGAFVCALAVLEIGWGAPYEYTSMLELATFVTVPIAGVLALRRAPRLRAALAHRSGLARLASIQHARALGVVFLVLLARDELPGLFVYPAAWGDVAVAVTAPIATWAIWFRESEIRRPGSRWRKVFIGWNVMGLLDHVVAVALGIAHFPGLLQVFGGEPSTIVFADLPMMLFPVYMVPFACLLHLIMIDVVRHPPPELGDRPPGMVEADEPSIGLGARA